MATITITFGDAVHEVRLPFPLGTIEDAGDAIDRFNECVQQMAPALEEKRPPPMRAMAAASRAALEAFCIAINLQAPGAIDFAGIAAKVSLEDATPLVTAMSAALRGSGFAAKGEATGERGGKRPSASARPSKRKSAA